MSEYRNIISILTITTGMLCSGISNSYAQDVSSSNDRKLNQRNNRLLEEVIVTAQKREENISDVPVSISAFSGEAMDARGINDPQELAQSIPGINYGKSVNFSLVYIRGIGTDAFLPDSDQSVATYIDGIYLPGADGVSQSLGAIERVEVLKGPQGTLFGRNATGGAINIVSKKPTVDETYGSVAFGYADFDQLTSRLFLNVPLHDNLAINLSLAYSAQDNYYTGSIGQKGTTEPAPIPEDESFAGRLRLHWAPSDYFNMTLTAIKQENEALGSGGLPNKAPSDLMKVFYTATKGTQYAIPDDYVINVDTSANFKFSDETVYGEFVFLPSWFDVKVLASYQQTENDTLFDFDGTDAPFAIFDAPGQYGKYFTSEIQLISNGESGPDWLEWVAGAYYLDQDGGYPSNRLSVGDLDLTSGSLLGGIQIPPLIFDALTTLTSALGVPLADGVSVRLISLQAAEALAFYGQTKISLGESFDLTLGLRQQVEERTVINSSSALANVDGSETPLLDFGTPSKKSSNVSPKVVLGYKPLEDWLIYGSWSVGYKSGTFNTVNIYDEPEYVEPEEVTSTEIGAKIKMFDSQLQINGAIFKNEVQDQQVQFVSLLAGGAVQLENAAELEIEGLELEFQYRPDWSEGLFITASGSYLDSSYISYPNASGFTGPGGLYDFGGGDNTGNEAVRTPKFSANISINKHISFSHGDLELGTNFYYNSGFYFQSSNVEASRQDDYYLLNAQLSYLHADTNIRITLLGKNLTDTSYALTQFADDAGILEYLAPPKTIGLRLDWSFGN